MPLSEEFEAIFIHIPRTGGNSVNWLLNLRTPLTRRFSTDSWIVRNSLSLNTRNTLVNSVVNNLRRSERRLVGYDRSTRTSLTHLTAMSVRARVPEATFNDYFKFTCVRNPYDRLVSEYFYNRDGLGTFKGSFEQFVMSIEAWFPDICRRTTIAPYPAGLFPAHSHFIPQYHYIHDDSGNCLVDFVARFERFQEDVDLIRERLDIRRGAPWIWRTLHEPYRCYYTDATRKTVERIYRIDCDTFDYDF